MGACGSSQASGPAAAAAAAAAKAPAKAAGPDAGNATLLTDKLDVDAANKAEVAAAASPAQADDRENKAVRVNFAEEPQHDGDEDAKSVGSGRAKGRKGTGFVTKAIVQSVLDEEEDDEEEADGKENKTARVNFAEEPQSDEDEDAKSVGSGRAKGRKGTGFVTKEKLQSVLNDLSEEEEADDKESKAARVNFAEDEDDDAKSCGSGRAKGRKGTGFVTKEKLQSVLNDLSGEEEEDDNAVRVSFAEDAQPSGAARTKVRKGTGFVKKETLQSVIDELSEEEGEEGEEEAVAVESKVQAPPQPRRVESVEAELFVARVREAVQARDSAQIQPAQQAPPRKQKEACCV